MGTRTTYRSIGVLIAIAMAGSSVLSANAALPRSRALANRNVTPGLAQAVRVRRASPNRTLEVTISLALRNQAALDRFIARVSDPRSRGYGGYLRPAQFAALYGPTPAQVQQVVEYLRSQGLTTTSVSANRTLVTASGAARAVETAFGVNIWDWRDLAENRDFFGNDTQPVLPASLAASIVGIAGLNNHYQAHRLGMRAMAQGVRAGSGPAGGYTPSELKSAYDIAPLAAQGYTGFGQPLGLVEFDGFNQANIDKYDSQYGLSTLPPSVVTVDGASTTPGANQLEVELDIEVLHAIAPRAPITVWEAPNTDTAAIHLYNAIVVSDSTPANSTSWGLCEANTAPSLMAILDAIFRQAAAQGQSFFAASGDTGAYDCLGSPYLGVDNPASDPYVTAVGGTTLSLNSSGGYVSESAWSWASHSPRLGSGGGLSQVFSQPAWQSGPGVANSNSTQMRQLPDVALDADTRTGYSIYTTTNGATGWYEIGGTSAGAPAWAAFTAILNQYRFVAGGDRPAIGFANPALYALGSGTPPYPPFHDVTTGDNLYYQATVGWDFATGWGSFDGYNLARDLAITGLPQAPPQAASRTQRPTPPVPPPGPRPGTNCRCY
jgi:kumamolisin